MFPENLVQACFQQVQTVYKPKTGGDAVPTATPRDENVTTAAYDGLGWNDEFYQQGETVDVTTAESLVANVTEAVQTGYTRGLKYTDGVNVLGALTIIVKIAAGFVPRMSAISEVRFQQREAKRSNVSTGL